MTDFIEDCGDLPNATWVAALHYGLVYMDLQSLQAPAWNTGPDSFCGGRRLIAKASSANLRILSGAVQELVAEKHLCYESSASPPATRGQPSFEEVEPRIAAGQGEVQGSLEVSSQAGVAPT